jgi:hypothetical protein
MDLCGDHTDAGMSGCPMYDEIINSIRDWSITYSDPLVETSRFEFGTVPVKCFTYRDCIWDMPTEKCIPVGSPAEITSIPVVEVNCTPPNP